MSHNPPRPKKLDFLSCHLSFYSKLTVPSFPIESDSSFLFGVDWSDKAHSTSHCWFPYCSKNSSPVPSCAYTLCTISQSIHASTFVQCGSCTIFVHRDHVAHLEKTVDIYNHIPPCRPSFSDSSIADNYSEHDRHYWSPVSALMKPCMRCKQKNMSQTLNVDNARILTVPTKCSISQDNIREIHVMEQSDSKLIGPSSSLVCLWCSKGCHRRCWESMNDDDEQNKCDYGKFK
jgi:hypothetical protein